ncbi:hypothetical protein CAOG_03620 [Capsaspora owczarzaki ATCC 30864]|uniref:hypothetical protein n=1 Tax=Capsaspora owczarzaki (strain ATCC 30864) TaxID=595528 RepID=UPI00035264D3|nr:hypothetical protein CAOG_03620 [Capsaspora owczarzaki ATCC 30864]|eukprot:XP_004363348.2 hypothetical protein CAOG_03620 [Capsaspora owczarzaki ATCC 30864]
MMSSSTLGDGPHEVTAHPHPVSFSSTAGWSCDGARTVPGGCSGGSVSGARRFRCCERCNFDLCDKCVAASLKSPPAADAAAAAAADAAGASASNAAPIGDDELVFTKQHGHPVKYCSQAGWSCDGCRGRPEAPIKRYKCAQGCNFDVCTPCLMSSRLAADDPSVLQKEVDAATEFFRSKLSYAKSQPVTWMERVTEAYTEVRARIATLQANTALATNNDLQALIAQTQLTMATHEDSLMAQVAERKLDDDKGFVQRRIAYARQNGLRFMDRVAEAHTDVQTRLAAMETNVHYQRLDPGLQAYIDEQRAAVQAYERELALEKRKSDLSDDIGYVRRRHQEIVNNHLPRFPDRARDAAKEAKQRLDKVGDCEAFYGLDEVDTFLAEFTPKLRDALAEADRLLLEDAVSKAVWNPNHFVGMAIDTLDRIGSYGDQALGHFTSSEEGWARLEFEHEDWLQQPVFLEAKQKFRAKADEFRKRHDEVVLKEEAKKALESARSLLSFVESYRRGHFGQALDYLRQSKDKTEAIRADARLTRLPEVQEFLLEHTAALAAKQAELDEELLTKEVADATSKALQLLSFVPTYFKSGHEGQALDYLQQSKEACDAVLTESRFVGRPELEPFLVQYGEGRKAFEQQYRETVLARTFKEATEKATQLLSHAFTYDNSGHYGQALDYLRQARHAHMDAMTDARLLQDMQQELAAFDGQFKARAAEYEQLYNARTYAEQAKEARENVSRPLGFARMHLDSHRNGQALEDFRRAQSALKELQDDPRFAADAELQSFAAQQSAQVDAFKADFEQRAVSADYKQQSEGALQLLSHANTYFDSHHRSQALDYLQQAKRAAAVVNGSTTFANAACLQEALAAFRTRFTAEAVRFAERYDTAVLDGEVREALDTARQQLNNANTYFDSHHDAQSLEYFHNARARREEILGNARWRERRGDELRRFQTEFDANAADYLRRYADREFATELNAAESLCNDNLSHANTYFDSHRTGQALDYYSKATAAAGALAADARFTGVPRVTAFLPDFAARATAFRTRFAEREFADRLKEARDKVSTNLSHANTYFDSHRRSQALEYLQQARTALLAYRADSQLLAEESTSAWLADVDAGMRSFEQRFAEVVFKEQLDKAIGGITQQLTFAEQAITGHAVDVPRCLAALKLARQQAAELGADPQFLNNDRVHSFLSQDFEATTRRLEAEVRRQLAAQQLRSVQSDCTTNLNSSRIYFASQHRSQAFDLINKARDAVDRYEDELKAEPVQQGEARAFIEQFRQQLAECQTTYSQALFNEELSGLVRAAESILTDAEGQFAQRRRDVALEQLEKAKDAAEKLSDPKFFGVPQVEQFFNAWRARIEAFHSAFNSAVFAEQLTEAEDKVCSHFHQARALFDQGVHDGCAEQLREATSALAALAGNPSFVGVARATSFVESVGAKVAAFRQEANDTIHRQAVAKQVQSIREQLTTANTLYGHHAYSSALEQFNAAKDKLKALVEADDSAVAQHALVVAFKPDAQALIDTFAKAFAAQQLSVQARDFVVPLQTVLNGAQVLVTRGLWDAPALKDAVTQLNAALRELPDPLLAHHADVRGLIDQVAAVQKQYAERVLTPTAAAPIADALRQLDGYVAKFIDRDQFDKALEAFDERVRTPTAFLWTADTAALYALLPVVHEFFARVAEFCRVRLAGRTSLIVTSGLSSSGASSSGSSSGPRTLLAVLGGTLDPPSSDYLKVATIPLTVDINPSIYTAVKSANTIAGQFFTATRELSRALAKMAFSEPVQTDMHIWHSTFEIFSRDTAGYPIESIEQYIKDYRRWVTDAKQDAPEDATTKTFVGNFATFEERWAEMTAFWKKASAMGKTLGQVILTVGFLKAALEHGKGCLGHAGVPVINLHHSASIIGGCSLPSSAYDYEIFLLVIDRSRQLLAKIDELETAWGGFPNKPTFVNEITELITEARRLHPQHCIWAAMHLAGNLSGCRDNYVQGLRRFPIARRVLKERLRASFFKNHSRRLHTMKECKPVAYHINDAIGTPSDVFEETEEEYALPYQVIVPGLAEPKQPFGNRADQSQSSHAWTSVSKSSVGKIFFANELIDASVSSTSAFKSEFSATDNIYGRAWWPRSLNNYALALDKKDGKPIYGPEHLFNGSAHDLEFLLFVTVDGKQVKREGQIAGAFTWFRASQPNAPSRGERHIPGQETDFWAYSQTCRLQVSLNEITHAGDDWVNVANRFRRLFKTLCNGSSPSSHKIKIDLCFRVVTNHTHFESKPGKAPFPLEDTPISAPIASGEFTVKVPARPEEIILPTMFRRRNPDIKIPRAVALDYENQIKDWLNKAHGWGVGAKALEQTFHVVIDSDWYVCNTEYFKVTASNGRIVLEKEPVRYGLECYVYFYRSVEKGWLKEEIACFNLTAMAQQSRNPASAPPFTGVAVGSNFTFDADLLPDDVLANIKRCPEPLRSGLFDLDKLPHLDYASWVGPQAPMFSGVAAASSSSSS